MAADLNVVEQFAGGVKNLNTGSFANIMNSPAIANLWFFLKLLFMIVLVLGIIIIIYKTILQYKIRVTIFKKVGYGGLEITYDRAKIVSDLQGKRKLQLLKTRKSNKKPCTFPEPEAKYKGKIGKFDHYVMAMDDNHEFHPIETPLVEGEVKHLKIRPQERDAWARMENDQLYEKFRKKDWLAKYAAPAIVMTACITAFLIFFFASKEIGKGLTDLAQQFAQIASSCTKLAG